MISFIKGTITSVDDSSVILNCHDIGFQISMPSSALYRVSEGMETVVYTHLAVKEDDMSLYGFLSMDDLRMFKQLITVSGIGPKGALSILSSISVEELKMAIAAEDAKLIAGSKGVGLKTAQKLVLELKGKLKGELAALSGGAAGSASSVPSGKNLESAILFVEATGISRTECMRAIAKAEVPSDADIDTIIDLIYKHLTV